MYRVVIVDDEPIIVEGLTKLIPWDKYDCQIVATAHNGLEGQAAIREHKPDMIFSDICMPGQDGLNMIAAIKSEFPRTMITILTGYRDFDYAQQAIRLGVARFLLKPSKIDELEEAVAFMKAKLDELYTTEDEVIPAEERIEKSAANDQMAATAAEDELLEKETGSFIVDNALTYIEQHYAQKLTLLEVADQIYVSQWHLSKLLNRHLGKSFSDVLNGARVAEAKKLLKDPSLRICDIAEMVGFVDTAHFSRVFKKMAGISANVYRNQIGIREREG